MNPPIRSQRRRPRRRAFILLMVLLLLAGGAYGAWNWFGGGKDEETTRLTAKVSRGDIENLVTATGTLQPRRYVDVGAQISGQVMAIHVEVGSQVEEGQLLAEIDPTVYLARVDASRAQLRYQRAQLQDREAQLALARITHTRQRNLYAEDATTLESLQTAEAGLKSAQAQIEMLKAQIEQTESSLRADEANLEYSRILAPMAGTVVSITARQGQTLNANQQAPIILQIAELSTMTVQTQVSEADISRLQPGMAVYFTTLGGGERRWYGSLERIEPTPTVTNNVVLYNALFNVPNPRHFLMTQMTAQVFFIESAARDTLLVPMSALTLTGPAAGRTGRPGMREARPGSGDEEPPVVRARRGLVTVLKDDGRIEERVVEIGVSNRVQAQVLSGLEEGETVVLAGRAPTAPSTTPRQAGGDRIPGLGPTGMGPGLR
ncbi:periplasmic component of efflux system [Ectothiorhodospira sp. PHS-1]|uniref:efflux RND transporter periplasmic adaptor subunit n=1 Tax=Ectothiorhodospira sp. PHS-1 TaxID=519989 RepID=UPI00024A88B7|nr:efflux RND transporter periplasmic adaptor subunit [Ectothiorhodospira sp. PHS-1]EHQ51289.1 periplasmic component of efflux system [Ectothiorhodospira sp. PHS-1]